MSFHYMKDFDIERPNSDFPDYEEYKEPMEWDLWDDEDLMEFTFEEDENL